MAEHCVGNLTATAATTPQTMVVDELPGWLADRRTLGHLVRDRGSALRERAGFRRDAAGRAGHRSEAGADVQADLGVDHGLLRCGHAVRQQRGVERHVALHDRQCDRAELVVPGRGAHEADVAPVE
jgi:hypothetical protein